MARSSTAPDDAAKDGEEDKSAYTASDADDEVFVVVDPAANFLGCIGAFTPTLLGC